MPFVVENAEADEVKMVASASQRPQHQKLERRVGAVEGIADAFQPLQLFEQGLDLFVTELGVDTELARLVKNIGPARKLGKQHVPVVTDLRRIDMFVGLHVALDPGHMKPGLVREGARPTYGLPQMRRDIGELVDQPRSLFEGLELFRQARIDSQA